MQLRISEFIDTFTNKSLIETTKSKQAHAFSSDEVIAKTVELLNGLTNEQRAAVTNYSLTVMIRGYQMGLDSIGFVSLPDLRDDGERIVIDF